MTDFVIDTNVVIKWVIEEEGTPERFKVKPSCAADLLFIQCADPLWNKMRRQKLRLARAAAGSDGLWGKSFS